MELEKRVFELLLDFYPAFAAAQNNIAGKLGIEPSKEFLDTDEKYGWKPWKESGLDKTDEKDVQDKYHVYYHDLVQILL